MFDLAISGATIVSARGRRRANVDGHVHFQDPGDTTREDLTTGTSASAVGGVTTVIEHTHSDPIRTVEFLREKVHHVSSRSLIDFDPRSVNTPTCGVPV
jgi:dihydroorotase-like cyclic amidohydrolase